MIGLYVTAKALRHSDCNQESIDVTFKVLTELGEDLPRPNGDSSLSDDMQAMNDLLRNTRDDDILNMQQTNEKRIIMLQKLYANLAHVLHFYKPTLMGSVSLRMCQLSMKTGLSAKSPLGMNTMIILFSET